MRTILVDYNMEGQAAMLWDTLEHEGWPEVIPIHMVMFADVGLAPNTTDRMVWRFAQQHAMVLLTNNRSDNEEDSLEQTLREENTSASYPVLTIGNLDRIQERHYREQCVERLIEILFELEKYLGIGRLFLP